MAAHRARNSDEPGIEPSGFDLWAMPGRVLRGWLGGYGSAELDGAQGRNRTTDTAIFSRMLYQLSYLGVLSEGPKAHRAGGL